MENIIWKEIKGYEGMYEVSNDGEVRTIGRVIYRKKFGEYFVKPKLKKTRKTKLGYIQVALIKENITHNTYLHRIIGEAFISKPEGCNVINHINGIKTDNRIENLEWTTSSYNNLHALDNNLRTTRRSMSKELISRAVELKGNGMTNEKIAHELNSTEAIIQGITSGTTYKRLRC